MSQHRFYYFERSEDKGNPAGVTVSKKPKLPQGDFSITEYTWPEARLWFIDRDEFTADERQAAYVEIGLMPGFNSLTAVYGD